MNTKSPHVDMTSHLDDVSELSWGAHCLLLLAGSIPLILLFGKVYVGTPPDLVSGTGNMLYPHGWLVPVGVLLAFLLISRSRQVNKQLSTIRHFMLLSLIGLCVLIALLGYQSWLMGLVPIVIVALNYGRKPAIVTAVLMCALLAAATYLRTGIEYHELFMTSIVLMSLAYLVGGITERNRMLVEELNHERFALRNLLDGLPQGVCLFQNGHLTYHNSRIGEDEMRLCEQFAGSDDSEVETGFEGRHYRVYCGQYLFQPEDSRIVVIDDLSETRKLEGELRRASHLASIGEMAAGVAHEIRNPLTVIQGYVQLLLESRQERTLSEVRSYLETALGEIKRLGFIVNDFLHLARPQTLEKVFLNLNDIASELHELLAAEATRRDVKLAIELAPSLAQIKGHPGSLKQVILNLVANAFQAAGSGGTVGVRTWQRGRRVVMEVTDSGPGIPEELKEKIFLPFFSTKPLGTGIGLSICRRIALDHGSALTCRSEPGNTRFVLEIPAASD